MPGLHLENCPGGEARGNGRNLDLKEGDMNAIWGGRCMLEYMCVCGGGGGFIQDLEFWEGGTPKFSVDVERCIVHNN